MLAYFLRPFVAESHFQVMASLSEAINIDKETTIQAAPHHFELWCLAEIDEETGRVTGKPEHLADCSSLVRDRVRTDRERLRAQTPTAPSGDQGQAGDRAGGTTAAGPSPRNGALTTPLAAPQDHSGPRGSAPAGTNRTP